MDGTQALAVNAVLPAAMASPGPALAGGAGIASGFGPRTMAAAWTLALFGIGTGFAVLPWVHALSGTAGAICLISIAYSLSRDACAPLPDAAQRVYRAVRVGLPVRLDTPTWALIAAGVLWLAFPSDLGPTDWTRIVINLLVLAWIVYTAIAPLRATRPARDGGLRFEPLLDRVCGRMRAAPEPRPILFR